MYCTCSVDVLYLFCSVVVIEFNCINRPPGPRLHFLFQARHSPCPFHLIPQPLALAHTAYPPMPQKVRFLSNQSKHDNDLGSACVGLLAVCNRIIN